MSGLDQIVKVDISISTPVVDGTSFDNILIMGPAPTVSPTTPPKAVAAYSDLQEVIDAGFKATGDNADPVGIAAKVAFSQSPRPTTIYIAVQQEDPNTPGTIEDIEDTITRALNVSGWYVLCPAGIDSTKYESIAGLIETQNKLFIFTSLAVDPGFSTLAFYRTAWIFGRESIAQLAENVPVNNKYSHVAWACTALNYHAGSETWAYKSMSLISPSSLTTQECSDIEAKGGNYYTTVASKDITRPGKVVKGEWIDTIRFRDWLQNDMQIRIYNLFITNPKVPYTDRGIGLVQNQMIASLNAGQRVGGVAETEYNSDGEEVRGFTVTVPKASSLTEAQRASRKLTGCKFSARLAGAIHVVEIKGSLVY